MANKPTVNVNGERREVDQLSVASDGSVRIVAGKFSVEIASELIKEIVAKQPPSASAMSATSKPGVKP